MPPLRRLASLRWRGLRTFALIAAAVACCAGLVAPAQAAAQRSAEARTPLAGKPPAKATRHAAPRRVARAAPRQPALRDAPHELIPAAIEAERFGSPRAACLAATRRAERVHGLPEGLLTAIALAESGLHAHALNIGGRAHFPHAREDARALLDAARPSASVMAGCVQVNARVHARGGAEWPLDATMSADWAGGMLARWARERGDWAEALRRWHGGSPASTQRLVCRVRAKMEVTNPAAELFEGWGCSDDRRTRANGAAHLRLAAADLRG